MKRSTYRTTAFLTILSAFASVALGQIESTRSLTLDGARAVAKAAAGEAHRLGVGGAIAVVDVGGSLLYLERLDGTFPAAAEVALQKARTAATFRRPTSVFEDAIRNGRTSLVAVDVMLPLQGGVPVVVDGAVVGAIGVSGAASAQQDEELAVIGSRALASSQVGTVTGPLQYFASDAVRAGFDQGSVLLDAAHYAIHASHRTSPGQAEVHEQETDIMYVISGKATLVTGGSVVEGRTTGPSEIRGTSIDGGETRKLVPGDVVVIPSGLPHWFREVHGTFDYYVVKVRNREGLS